MPNTVMFLFLLPVYTHSKQPTKVPSTFLLVWTQQLNGQRNSLSECGDGGPQVLHVHTPFWSSVSHALSRPHPALFQQQKQDYCVLLSHLSLLLLGTAWSHLTGHIRESDTHPPIHPHTHNHQTISLQTSKCVPVCDIARVHMHAYMCLMNGGDSDRGTQK